MSVSTPEQSSGELPSNRDGIRYIGALERFSQLILIGSLRRDLTLLIALRASAYIVFIASKLCAHKVSRHFGFWISEPVSLERKTRSDGWISADTLININL